MGPTATTAGTVSSRSTTGKGWPKAISHQGILLRPALRELLLHARRSTAAVWIVVAGALFVMEALVIFVFGTHAPGPILSNLVQLGMGITCVLACSAASRRSGPLGCYFWRLMTATFLIWVIGQSVGTYAELFLHPELLPGSELLFALSAAPFGMALFLDPEH